MLRKAALYPGRYDPRYLRGLTSIRDFDDQITARYCGFDGAQDYYTRAAASKVVDRIAVPTLVLNSLDDPFIRVLPETREKLVKNPAHHVCRDRTRRPLRLPRGTERL